MYLSGITLHIPSLPFRMRMLSAHGPVRHWLLTCGGRTAELLSRSELPKPATSVGPFGRSSGEGKDHVRHLLPNCNPGMSISQKCSILLIVFTATCCNTSETEGVDESDDYIDVHHPLPINFSDGEEDSIEDINE